ncbi:MAG: hypothetical protein AB7O28_17445 [Vicinamibacterales bacterium]
MRVSSFTRRATAVMVTAAAMWTAACGDVARSGRSPAYLVLVALDGASGAEPDKFGSTVSSDVVTLVEVDVNGEKVKVPTIFGDIGRATFRIGLKDPGTPDLPTQPTSLNDVTVTRYRVVYRRADGRNTQGVDVPYAHDGGMTVTVRGGQAVTGFFDLVRVVAKREPPLANLRNIGGAQFIGTVAEITFWGADQAGNEVSVTGEMSVSFADYGDPQ